MSNKKTSVIKKIFIQFIIFVIGILFLVFIDYFFVARSATPDQSQVYPQPKVQSYPFPVLKYPTNPLEATLATFTPFMARDAKDGHILSPTEISAIATYASEKSQLLTPPSTNKQTNTKSGFPVNSLNEIAQVVYHDPFYSSEETGLGDCIQARNPGSATLVHSLDADPDYYIVPFFKNNQLCAKAIIEIKNGLGYVNALSQGFGDMFPQISAEEAVQQVTSKTGKQVVDKPILAFMKNKMIDPFNPFWKVTTTDNQIYYVTFITGMFENQVKPKTIITVLKSDEIQPLK